MHRSYLIIPLAVALLSACASSRFGWQDEPQQDIRDYRASFLRAAGKTLTDASTRNELLDEIRSADTIWLGDHHRHSLLHGLHLELLEQVQRRGNTLLFGLEAIGIADEPDVRDYLADRIDMVELRRRVRARWDGSWLDDRELDPWYFQSLLRFAKRNLIPVFALEPTPRLPLHQRDAMMAQAITYAAERHPQRTLVMVVGQTHLVGDGDLVARSGRGGVVFGATPPPALLDQPSRRLAKGSAWRSDAGIYWFREVFPR